MSFNSRLNIEAIYKIIGALLIIEAVSMMLGLLFAFYYDESYNLSLLWSGLITAGVGGSMWVLHKDSPRNFGKREGYIIVAMSWVVLSVFGCLPYLFSGTIDNFTDAFFETMSGFTTTGATILMDIESVQSDILFWRSMTQWLGGMGIIVLFIAVLPFLGMGGSMNLYSAEAPGLTKDKLHPKIKVTAKRLWLIYTTLTAVLVLLLWCGEMDFFESVCHALTCLSTGGFSTNNDSLAGSSIYTQYVIIFFMTLASINFALQYYFIIGRFKKVFSDNELKLFITIILTTTAIITIGLIFSGNGENIEYNIRTALFQVISIITTTGYGTTDYMLWPSFGVVIILFLMFVGGCAGSTSGGIKVIRHLILLKNAKLELNRIIHPNAVMPITINKSIIHESSTLKVMAFISIYFMIIIVGFLFMSVIGVDFEASYSSVITCLDNCGPGMGSVGPVSNFMYIPKIGKWFLSLLMLMGRLELFTVLTILMTSFWRK